MQIKHLNLVNFRNYESVDISFKPGINLLFGHNGEGKTSLVEAIIYSSSLSGPRFGGYQTMIRVGADQAIIRALAKYLDREFLIELELNQSEKNRAKINYGEYTNARNVLGYVQTVHFAPQDNRIVQDDPLERRWFIDELIMQSSPRFVGVFSDYDRALKQRNSLLKNLKAHQSTSMLETLAAWNESLVKFGSQIISKRYELATKLEPHLQRVYKRISDDPRIATVTSLSSVFGETQSNDEDSKEVNTSDVAVIEEMFARKLLDLQSKEIERGFTLAGPHRDELKLMLGEFPVKGYTSYGETWLFAVSLKLACAEVLRSESQSGDPILILDDVFSSLDDNRLQRLIDLISDYEQVIITDAIRGKMPVFEKVTKFEIQDGKVRELIG
jgi:DNA replication and repair protein RecF